MNNTLNIMVVDDTPANLKLLANMLRNNGYEVRPLQSGKMALNAARMRPPDLILLDINMPEMSGYEVCEHLKADLDLRGIPVIFISALTEAEDKVQAFHRGGVDYVTKPFQSEEVLARVKTHLELRRHQVSLETLVRQQVQEIVHTKEELSQAQLATILALSKLAEARDGDTGHHIERTQTFCRLLAEELRRRPSLSECIDDIFIESLYHAAPLHDIGKVGVPDAVLRKPGRLTADEFETMKQHTVLGSYTLEAVRIGYPKNVFVKLGIEIARSHHEKWNGTGYPDALTGEHIPISARIMALADVYDALTSHRCYKKAFPHEKCREIIVSERGTHFDPEVVDAFMVCETHFSDVREQMGD